MPDFSDGGTIAFIAGTLVALLVVVGIVGFALWYVGEDQTEL